MEKKKWEFETYNTAIADTGDYEGCVIITNGDEKLHSCGDDIEEEELQTLCDLLNLMPDLWSEKVDGIEIEKAITISSLKHRLERFTKIKNEVSLEYKGKEDKLTYWAGFRLGYLKGKLSEIENSIDRLDVSNN